MCLVGLIPLVRLRKNGGVAFFKWFAQLVQERLVVQSGAARNGDDGDGIATVYVVPAGAGHVGDVVWMGDHDEQSQRFKVIRHR